MQGTFFCTVRLPLVVSSICNLYPGNFTTSSNESVLLLVPLCSFIYSSEQCKLSSSQIMNPPSPATSENAGQFSCEVGLIQGRVIEPRPCKAPVDSKRRKKARAPKLRGQWPEHGSCEGLPGPRQAFLLPPAPPLHSPRRRSPFRAFHCATGPIEGPVGRSSTAIQIH